MRLFWYPTSGKIKRRIVSKIRTSYMFSRTDISLWMLSTGLTFNIITHHQCQLNATLTAKNLSLTTLSHCNYEICYRIAFAAHFPLLMLNTVVKSSSLPFLTFKSHSFSVDFVTKLWQAIQKAQSLLNNHLITEYLLLLGAWIVWHPRLLPTSVCPNWKQAIICPRFCFL